MFITYPPQLKSIEAYKPSISIIVLHYSLLGGYHSIQLKHGMIQQEKIEALQ